MAMNIYRLTGDMCHQIAIILLIVQLCRSRNARGISIKTQELRLLVFSTRYLDLFTTYYSLYNSVAKVYYLVATTAIIIMCKTDPIKRIYNADHDYFPHWKLAVLPCSLLALVTHIVGSGISSFDVLYFLWTFSIYLESIAILPQLLVLRRYRLVENLTGKIMLLLGLYRFFYILNWIYRAHHELMYQHSPVVYICGTIQTLLYADFFYQYARATRFCGCSRDEARTNNYTSGVLGDDDVMSEDEDDDGLVFEISRSSQQPADASQTKPLLNITTCEDGDSELRARSAGEARHVNAEAATIIQM
mmetsp:Transcript_28138/g.81343  ORF Transcript_28138/g.81343 Transcript_28138/m.81343 type:complete len:304 (+) Transcript_28138:233-1144(+)